MLTIRGGFSFLIAVLLCGFCVIALADEANFCSEPPEYVWRYVAQKNEEYQQYEESAGITLKDYVQFDMPQGQQGAALLYENSGYPWLVLFQEANDSPASVWEPFSAIPNQKGLYFRRHTAEEYGDDLGFTVMGEKKQVGFHYFNGSLRTSEWCDLTQSMQTARIEDGALVYRDCNTMHSVGSIPLVTGEDTFSAIVDFERLPWTFEQAQRMNGIARSAAATLYPEWTMYAYVTSDSGHYAEAHYLRIESDQLLLRFAKLDARQGNVVYDMLPLPLSSVYQRLSLEEAIEKLQKQEMHLDSTAFWTENIIDVKRLPVSGKVLQSDIQPKQLLLLTQEADERYIWLIAKNDQAYVCLAHVQLPADVWMDTLHAGFDCLSLEWNGQSRQCAFFRSADGRWMLDWATGEDGYGYSVQPYGISAINGDSRKTAYGSFPYRELSSVDFALLPGSFEEAIRCLNRNTLAVVSNPDPKDRLHLRVKPEKSAQSLGKFYNGTPLQVLERKGEWVRVTIANSELTGWMMERYLVHRDDCDGIAPAFPMLCARENGAPIYSTHEVRTSEQIADASMVDFTIIGIGVVGEEQYILLLKDGRVGYAMQNDFWEGNG